MEEVILVNEADEPIGTAEKHAAHTDGGQLHRAVSVFVFNSAGELLIQRRAAAKYHFGGRWSNTCCGHPRPGESTQAAAHRRLREEFGIDVALRAVTTFTYEAHDAASRLTEREIDHIFVGSFDGSPEPDPAEIEAWAWATPADLQRDLAERPERYSPWFPIALSYVQGSAGVPPV